MSTPSQPEFREPRSIARLSRTFSQGLCAVDLAEPLLSLDDNQPAEVGATLLRMRKAGVLGVRRAGLVAGWVSLGDLAGGTLGEHLREFRRDEILDESASLAAVLGALAAVDQVFVEWLGEVNGVITRRDLQKPPLRMWLFGAITVLDTNLTWAIEQLHPENSWQGLITAGRLEKALALHAERRRAGSDCRLVDCLQIKDKADLLIRDGGCLAALGISSRRQADRLGRDIEKLRNHLAHAQELELEHLDAAARLASSIDTILRAEISRQIVALRHRPAGAADRP